MTRRRVLLSWSSGKDSAWTLYTLQRDSDVELVGLLTTFNTDADRVAMHAVRRELVMQHIATVPSEFTMHAPNPKRNRLVGRNAINFTPVASAPNCSDLEGGRRTGNFADYCNFLRLTHHYDVLDFISGYPVEPIDIHPDTRHLDASLAAYTLTDRAFTLYCLGGGRVGDVSGSS